MPDGYNVSDIRFVPAPHYAAPKADSVSPETVMGLVESGRVEMTDYVMSLNHDGAKNPNYDHMGQLFHGCIFHLKSCTNNTTVISAE